MTCCDPYLFRFKRQCMSPRRAGPAEGFFYDDNLAMVMVLRQSGAVPVIDTPMDQGPTTKKADIEKSEDQKDNWMWGT